MQQMEEEKPEDRLKTSPIENVRKEDTVSHELSPHRRNEASTSADEFTDPVEMRTDSDTQDHNPTTDDRIVSLDVLAKGTPPPTTGDPSPGRNHVTAKSSTIIDNSDGVKLDRAIFFEARAKSTQHPSVGDSSSGRNTISTRASISQSTSHGVKPDESKGSTTSRNGSKPNNQDHGGA